MLRGKKKSKAEKNGKYVLVAREEGWGGGEACAILDRKVREGRTDKGTFQ